MLSHFYEGKVSHLRITPRHALEYGVWFAYLHLDEVEERGYPSGLNDGVLEDGVAKGELSERRTRLLLHADARAEVHL